MATQAFVQVAADGVGKQVDAFTVETPAGGVQYRQGVVIADPFFASNVASVTGRGAVHVSSFSVEELLIQILVELRCQNTILQTTLNGRDDIESLRATEMLASLS